MTGTVKTLMSKKNFGFIKARNKEYFFHKDDFKGHWDDLVEDFESTKDVINVEFEEQPSQKGPRAANVRRTEWPNEGPGNELLT